MSRLDCVQVTEHGKGPWNLGEAKIKCLGKKGVGRERHGHAPEKQSAFYFFRL